MKNRGSHIVAGLLMGVLLISCATSRQQRVKAPVERVVSELTPAQQRKYDYFFLEALRLKYLKEYDAAFEMLQHCLAIDPNASSALYEMAQYYIYLKQMPQGEAALEKAVEGAPDNYWYSQGLANFYQQQNHTEKATKLLERMITDFPEKQDPFYALIDVYKQEENYKQVIHTLNRMEERSGKSEQLSMEKFRIYLQLKDDEHALQEIESLAKEYPKDVRYQVLLGDVYMQHGKMEEAYLLYQQALEAEPDNAMAMYSLSSYYEETGQKELHRQQLDSLLLNRKVPTETKIEVMRRFIVQNEQEERDSIQVINLFEQMLEQDPEDENIPMLFAQYLLSKGMEKESLVVLQRVLDIEPTNTAARMTLLGEAIRQENTDDVIRLCETGIETNPDMPEFYFYLAVGYNQIERIEDVITICQKALEQAVEKSKKEVISDFYTIMADAYHTLQQKDEAYIAYDSALVYNPSNISALNNYAYYLSLEHRDLDRAEEMSYKTIKAEPNNATYLDTYAWILFEKGKYSEARLYIDDAMKNEGEKESADIVEHCGDIYYMTGDVEAALNYWKQAQEMGSDSKTLKQKIQKKKYIAP